MHVENNAKNFLQTYRMYRIYGELKSFLNFNSDLEIIKESRQCEKSLSTLVSDLGLIKITSKINIQ